MNEGGKKEGMKEYELTVLTVNETEAVLFGSDIDMIHTEGPKSVALGYPIKKHTSAFLRVYIFYALPSVADVLNKAVAANQRILRHILVTPAIMTRRREAIHEQKSASIEIARPPLPEAVSNEALEAALENILTTNESR